MEIPRDRIAAFQRHGSILPLNLGDGGVLGSFVGNTTEEYKKLVLRIFVDKDMRIPFYSGNAGSISFIECSQSKDNKELIIEIPPVNDTLTVELIGIQARKVLMDEKLVDQTDKKNEMPSFAVWKIIAQEQTTEINLSAICAIRKLRIQY